jgi:Tfp pilus assembly protein PilX
MKTNSKMRNSVAKRREGLVLIIMVAILIVVSLVTIGIWSLSSATTRSGSAELA